jgi:hypothetical protein
VADDELDDVVAVVVGCSKTEKEERRQEMMVRGRVNVVLDDEFDDVVAGSICIKEA